MISPAHVPEKTTETSQLNKEHHGEAKAPRGRITGKPDLTYCVKAKATADCTALAGKITAFAVVVSWLSGDLDRVILCECEREKRQPRIFRWPLDDNAVG